MTTLHTRRVLALLVVAVAAAGLAGCDRESDIPDAGPVTETGLPSSASPSAVVIGVMPAEPTGETVQTTPVAANTTDIPKQVESEQKPQEGDNHSHSTLAPVTPQKAEGANAQEQPERKQQ